MTELSAASPIDTTGLDNLDANRPDLDRAFKTLKAKTARYNLLWDYYDGDQPLMYTGERIKKLFQKLELSKFVENWCAVVVDAANDRINLSSINIKSENEAKIIKELWDECELDLEASDIHEAALVIGESYMLIWPKGDEENGLDAFYNDPRLVHLFYEGSNPRKKSYGAKWWVDSEDHIRITLYYPERLEYYRSDKKQANVESIDSFIPYKPNNVEGEEKAENPTGQIPIFHFRTERRKVKGDLVNVIAPQNGINKLLTDMMVAAEYGAFKQRYIISHADTTALVNAPGQIWEVPAGDGDGEPTKVGQFDETPLENYIKGIDHLATSTAIISRTPKHYLFAQGGTPSGEALIAMEAPLNKRCSDHIKKFIPTWKEVVQFMLVLKDAKVKKADIEVAFDKPETVQPKTQAEIRKTSVDSGIPLVTVLREEGKSEAWIEQMQKDMEEEKEQNATNLGAVVAAALRDSNRSGFTPGDNQE